MGVLAYRNGVKKDQLPEPFYFVWGTAGMGIAGLAGMADSRLGVVLAWGLLIGAAVIDYNKRKSTKKTATANANPSASQITTRQVGTVRSAANVGVKKP